MHLLCEEPGERVNSALVELSSLLEIKELLGDTVGEPNNVVTCDDTSVGEQSPILG